MADSSASYGLTTNQAFIFIKPHAAGCDKVKEVVTSILKDSCKSMKVSEPMDISAEKIAKDQLIDKHYYAIASKATILKPNQLNVPADKFKAQFGVEWAQVLKDGLAYNALDAAKKLGNLNAQQMEAEWRKTKGTKDQIKFGGGFYCAKIKDIFVFNGFFMSMRASYVAPGAKIVAFEANWDSKELSWEKFRSEILGPTDPAKAPALSIRGTIYSTWEKLGLPSQPNTGDNGVHGSASPFEGLSELMNWMSKPIDQCAFGQLMKKSGIADSTINSYTQDPQVVIDLEGNKGSCYDALEDMDAFDCVLECAKLNLLN